MKTPTPPHSPPTPPSTSRFSLVVVTLGLIALTAPAWGQVIYEEIKITPDDGAEEDRFGRVVAISDGIIAVGSANDDDNGHNSGSAYLFEASTGELLVKLLANDGAVSDYFGGSIAIEGGIVAVAAGGDDPHGTDSGSVYLFDASTGDQIAKLTPDDGQAYMAFGLLALGNGTLAVSAVHDDDNGHWSGSAYLFDVATGEQLFKLLPSDGRMDDRFGQSIDIDGGIVAIGASWDDDNGAESGSAYLFDASTGLQIAKLTPGDGASGDQFGHTIAIENGVVVVGALYDDANGHWSGSAYLFDASTGVQTAKLLPSDGAAGHQFGSSVALYEGVVVIGAYQDDDNGQSSGSVYLFDASTGTQLAKLLPSDGAEHDLFGLETAIESDTVVVGASFDDDHGEKSGSVYVLDISCPVDLTHDGMVDTRDFIVFLNAWASGYPLANWKIDHAINTQDFLAYLGDWVAGCP